MEEKSCENCKFEHQEVIDCNVETRCNNCLMLTSKGRAFFPNWEEKDHGDGEHEPPIIHYI